MTRIESAWFGEISTFKLRPRGHHDEQFAIGMNQGSSHVRGVADRIQKNAEILRDDADNHNSSEFAMRPAYGAKQANHKSVEDGLERAAEVKNLGIGVVDG
ncbi:MAG: hypothetical protein NTY41_17415 [Proteobacteria bacterium]|nr:hypothetical protein [Pseudomonadota bacterium]